ncbi:MAG TPA: 3-deoxy-D-manno-octulosonic acid transferase [Burkholderiales bacterium]
MYRYRLLVWLLAPIFIGYTLWTALRYRDPRYLRERLGFARRADSAGATWLHAASVGEVNAAVVLVRRLAARAPNGRVVLTTVTPTGAAIARERLGDCVSHRYLPIDWPFAVRHFVRRLKPACLLVMETELWPHLYQACAGAAVPIIVVNGRLSLRSLHENRWWRRVQRETLTRVRAVLARTAADAETFLSLGVEAGRVRTIGNLKFAVAGDAPAPIALGRPYVLAASTRENEERAILEQWRACRHEGRLLVVAPRHPRRLAEILAALTPLGARVAVRTRREPIAPDTEVYLADTLGELGALMAGAEVVVMGGSFEPFGGHNILEPARLGKAVIFGPHMENFAEEAALLTANEAGIQLPSLDALSSTLNELLAQPDKTATLGKNAARLIAERSGVIDDYVAALAELCPALGLPA